MNDDQLQAWLDQHGGETGRKDNEKEVEDGSINPNTGAPGKKRTVDTTTITAKDGATLTLRRDTSGSGTTYQVIENTPPKPAAASAGTEVTRAAEAKARREREESEANAALPPDQDPRYETDEARAKRAQETIKQQGADAEAARQRQRQDEADARARAEANRPGAPTIKPDGKGGSIAVQTMPDGSIKTTPLPGVPSDTPTVTVGGIPYEKGPDGTYKPAAGIPAPTAAEPAGAPRPNTNYGQAAAGLTQYRDFLNTQVELNRASGGKQGITPQQADKLMETRLAQTKLTMEEQGNVVSTQTQMYGQQVSQRGQTLTDTAGRRTAAGNNYSTVLSNFMPLLKYMPKGGGEAFMRLLQGGVNYGQDQTAAWGGLRESPEIQYGPAAQAANRAPMPGQTSSSGTMSQYEPTAPAPAAAVTPPVAGPAQAAAATNAAQAAQRGAAGVAAEPPPGVMPSPPMPGVGPVAPPTPVPDTGGASAPQMGSVPPAAPQQADGNERLDDILTVMGPDGSQMEMPRHEYNSHPAQGQLRVTNARPAAPSADGGFVFEPGYRPAPPPQPAGPESNGTQSMMPPSHGMVDWGGQQQGPVGQTSFLSAYSQPPRPRSLDLLINDPDIPNEIVAEAYRRVYGRTPSLVG